MQPTDNIRVRGVTQFLERFPNWEFSFSYIYLTVNVIASRL